MRVEVILGSGLEARQVEELGVLAEQVGIDTVWVQSFPAQRDPLLTIAGLCRRTRRIRLGVMPTSPYEVHPLRIADGLLTLNELCGGRARLLVGGLGHSVMRVTGLKPAQRVAAVRDCVSILKGIRADEPLMYQGPVYTLQHYQPSWAVEQPPLVTVGATGPRMLRMSGEVADGVMMSDVPLSRMAEVLGHIRHGLRASGRDEAGFRVGNFMAWHIGSDRTAALAEARRELVWRGLLQSWHTAGFLGEEQAAFVEQHRDRFLQAFLARSDRIEGVPEALVDKLVEHLTFAGGPGDIERVAEELHRYAAAGQDEVALKVHGNPAEAVRLIGERLCPLLR